MSKLIAVADETIVHILEYLRATDLATCCEVDKTVFSRNRICKAIKYHLLHVYQPLSATFANTPMKLGAGPTYKESDFRPVVLYAKEMKVIMAALSYSPPVLTKGYWASASWISNAKKYFEALPLPDISDKPIKRGGKKQSKIRARRGSDALPPWPCINADILCSHGGLCLTKSTSAMQTKGKRKLLDKKVWLLLRKFYPQGPEFKSTICGDCPVCEAVENEAKALSQEKRETELELRWRGCDQLEPLLNRAKTGVPVHLLNRPATRAGSIADSQDGSQSGQDTPGSGVSPTSPTPNTEGSSDRECDQSALSPGNSYQDLRSALEKQQQKEIQKQRAEQRGQQAAERLQLEFYRELGYQGVTCGDTEGIQALTTVTPGLPSFEEFGAYLAVSMSMPNNSTEMAPRQPLLPGMYHCVPRSWLKQWRAYMRDPASALPPLDCTVLLCRAHARLVLPPHLAEYLAGLRRSTGLLSGLGSYSGEVVEIMSVDEWDCLQAALALRDGRRAADGDFNVRFTLDGLSVAWSAELCHQCHPAPVDPTDRMRHRRVTSNQRDIERGRDSR